jgi:hypothetical protein
MKQAVGSWCRSLVKKWSWGARWIPEKGAILSSSIFFCLLWSTIAVFSLEVRSLSEENRAKANLKRKLEVFLFVLFFTRK